MSDDRGALPGAPRVLPRMSDARRTVGGMTKQVQQILEHDVLDEACPRCTSTAVRVVEGFEFASFSAVDAPSEPLFDCRECGFEWGELVRDLMR